jgi:hypothetical protein
MELLGDVGHVESHFGPLRDSVSVYARKVDGLHQTYHRLRNRFGHTEWYSLVMRHVEAHFGLFGDSVAANAT